MLLTVYTLVITHHHAGRVFQQPQPIDSLATSRTIILPTPLRRDLHSQSPDIPLAVQSRTPQLAGQP
ncbi:hypothetical protein DL93DRAFT_2090923 [Clavulina sp. PMI_390]|nr:hypothetical protein DL93DRAFT_2090887 [Clavulina sp. PMI_390]KAF8300527.1 hypothetical protein DL93DRAFT_2090923 [Clavulina sp. PMI_390]